MENVPTTVLGHAAPPVRLTPLGMALMALSVALPAGVVIAVLDALW